MKNNNINPQKRKRNTDNPILQVSLDSKFLRAVFPIGKIEIGIKYNNLLKGLLSLRTIFSNITFE